MELVIGTKAWSTWSLRPWLVLKRIGAPFTEIPVPLRRAEETAQAIAPHSPSGKVPALKDGDLTVWDSLAICEYLAERFPEAGLWPRDPAARALARAACAEMHSGFAALRNECPMALDEPARPTELSEAVQKDVARITGLWREMLERFGGPFLFGDWTIADAFFTPVATRFRTYGVALGDPGDAYRDRLLQTAEFLEWERAALAETLPPPLT